MKLRIGVVQLNPILGRLEENIKRSTGLIEKAFKISLNESQSQTQAQAQAQAQAQTHLLNTSHKPDILVFPELALTGYNFTDSKDIAPFLEVVGEGPSYKFGSLIAKALQCYTVIGYPEKSPKDKSNGEKENEEVKKTTEATAITETVKSRDELPYDIYNSAMLIDPNGSVIYNYRKTHLYETDKEWGCIENPAGFETFDLNIKSRTFKTTIGICMDLNPWEFIAPFQKFEFANHVLNTNAELILVPTAWMNSSWSLDWTDEDVKRYDESFYSKQGTSDDIKYEIDISDVHDKRKDARMLHYVDEQLDSDISEQEEKDIKFGDFDREDVDFRTSKYWLIRFAPISSNSKHTTRILAICNRSGLEKESLFAGSSSIIRFNKDGELDTSNVPIFSFFGSLSQGTEGVLMREIEID